MNYVEGRCSSGVDTSLQSPAKPTPAAVLPDPVRDCEHGALKRSCERCDDALHIEALEDRLVSLAGEHADEIAALTTERDELRADLARVTEELENVKAYADLPVDEQLGDARDHAAVLKQALERVTAGRDRLAARVYALETCVSAVCDQASRVLGT